MGCKIFTICAKTQFIDDTFVERVLTEAKSSTCVIHLTGDATDLNVKKLMAIADEFSTTKGKSRLIGRVLLEWLTRKLSLQRVSSSSPGHGEIII